MKYIYIPIALFFLSSCTDTSKKTVVEWVHFETIPLDDINPIGIAQGKQEIWLSDGDRNRLVSVNYQGDIKSVIDSLDRPMHIATANNIVYIPQYGNDEILEVTSSEQKIITVSDSLDAPAGISVYNDEIAIADFYNHRIVFTKDQNNWLSFGKEGQGDGEFYYPTDVQVSAEAIWVADAYNNRVQKFNKTGTHLLTLGQEENMNAATGIFVSDKEVFATDFENDRVIVFDHQGKVIQILDEQISRPTDALISQEKLYITNYKSKSLAVFTKKEVEVARQNSKEHHNDEHMH